MQTISQRRVSITVDQGRCQGRPLVFVRQGEAMDGLRAENILQSCGFRCADSRKSESKKRFELLRRHRILSIRFLHFHTQNPGTRFLSRDAKFIECLALVTALSRIILGVWVRHLQQVPYTSQGSHSLQTRTLGAEHTVVAVPVLRNNIAIISKPARYRSMPEISRNQSRTSPN